MTKRYKTVEERKLIASLHEQGLTYSEIADKLGFSLATVHKWITRFSADLALTTNKKSGRKRKTTSEIDKLIKKTVENDPFTTAPELQRQLGLDYISVHTIRKRLRDMKLRSRVAAVSPRLTKQHIAKRLGFANDYHHWTARKWRRVMFSDEKIFFCEGKGHYRVWRPPKCRYDSKYLNRQNKNCPRKINIWISISWSGRYNFIHRITAKTLDSKYYVKHILKKYVPLSDDIFFMHDRAPMHTSGHTLNYLDAYGIPIIDWPPKGADLNPVENVWAELERRTKTRNFSSNDELWEEIRTTFENLSPLYFQNLIDSMPKRIAAVRDAKGDWINY